MFKGNLVLDVFINGGFTIWILILCSMICSAVIIQKLIYFWNISRDSLGPFMEKLLPEIKNSNYENMLKICKDSNSPFANVAFSGIVNYNNPTEKIENAMERQITSEIKVLEKFLIVLGTIGSVAVYIGLFGTVVGIIKAFHNLSSTASGGINIVIGGIAEALVSTAAGILVAVPSVIAYNYLLKRIENFTIDMELCASAIIDMLKK